MPTKYIINMSLEVTHGGVRVGESLDFILTCINQALEPLHQEGSDLYLSCSHRFTGATLSPVRPEDG